MRERCAQAHAPDILPRGRSPCPGTASPGGRGEGENILRPHPPGEDFLPGEDLLWHQYSLRVSCRDYECNASSGTHTNACLWKNKSRKRVYNYNRRGAASLFIINSLGQHFPGRIIIIHPRPPALNFLLTPQINLLLLSLPVRMILLRSDVAIIYGGTRKVG